MIKYGGMIKRGKIPYIIFSNEQEHFVEIPLDQYTAQLIAVYLEKISSKENKPFEHNNDEPAE